MLYGRWSYFDSFVPDTSLHCIQKFLWVTKKLNGLKNKATRAAKRMKKSERRCNVDGDIDDCDCEPLRDDITALRTKYQEHHGRVYVDYRIGIKEAIKTDPRSFF
jgi:hypothetical protein